MAGTRDTSRARATQAIRRALDAHRRVISYDVGAGARCACGRIYDSAEGWKKHQAQAITTAAEKALGQGHA